jgi:hypothetical protein
MTCNKPLWIQAATVCTGRQESGDSSGTMLCSMYVVGIRQPEASLAETSYVCCSPQQSLPEHAILLVHTIDMRHVPRLTESSMPG